MITKEKIKTLDTRGKWEWEILDAMEKLETAMLAAADNCKRGGDGFRYLDPVRCNSVLEKIDDVKILMVAYVKKYSKG